MLPNHSPLVIAEQFGTLESLFPGRIDLGLGRAPGTDQRTLRALRRDPTTRRVVSAGRARAAVVFRRSAAGASGTGRARHGAQRAALDPRLEPLRRAARRRARSAVRIRLALRARRLCCPRCRSTATTSARRRSSPRPYAMVGVNVIAADTDAEARRLFTSAQQAFTNLLRGARGQLLPPIDDIERYWSPLEKAQVQRMLACAFVGSSATIRAGLEAFVARDGRRRSHRRGRHLRSRGALALLRDPRRHVRPRE